MWSAPRGGAWGRPISTTTVSGRVLRTVSRAAAIQGWRHIGAWLGPAEITFVTVGGLALVASSLGPARPALSLVARVLAGASACVFGLVHFNYIAATAAFVPAWLPPSPEFWAWATGAGHLAACLALMSGLKARMAATCLAGMMAAFVLLVHVPRLFATPGVHAEWVMLGVASILTGAAWLIRKHAV
jgi:uncharacterized membrane protein YphA (DoxX/SURF4 family)